MKSKSNNRNAVLALIVLVGLFAAVIAGSGVSRNSNGDTGRRADSEKRAASRNAVGNSREPDKDQGVTKTEVVAEDLGPINPYVIAAGGGTSEGVGPSGNFSLDGTLGEVSSSEPDSGVAQRA